MKAQLAGCHSRHSTPVGLGCSQQLAFLLAVVQVGSGAAGLSTYLGNHWVAALTEDRSLLVADMTVWRDSDLAQAHVFKFLEPSLSLQLGWVVPELSPDWARMLIIPHKQAGASFQLQHKQTQPLVSPLDSFAPWLLVSRRATAGPPGRRHRMKDIFVDQERICILLLSSNQM